MNKFLRYSTIFLLAYSITTVIGLGILLLILQG